MADAPLPRVLVVGTINRPDILSMFDKARGQVELHFLEYFHHWGFPLEPSRYAPYGKVHCWHELKSAESFLRELRPERIFFMYVSSLNQIALRLAARKLGIPTYHLEHGFRRPFGDKLDADGMLLDRRRRFTWKKLRYETPVAAGNHAFFLRSLVNLSGAERRRLLELGWVLYVTGATPELMASYADLRRTDHYVAFSPATFAYHAESDRVASAEVPPKVHYVGVPYFDELDSVDTGTVDPRNVILVDHQFHNGNLFGWTLDFRKRWVAEIARLIHEHDLRLYVKEHPGDVSRSWEPHLAPNRIELVGKDGLAALMPSTRLVLGTFSTMQMPLAAMPHTAVVSLEIHPQDGYFSSRVLVEAGAAHVVRSFDELSAVLRAPQPILEAQARRKSEYVERFVHRRDGRAGERLRDILTAG
jgi:hypothetical protein